MSDCNHCVVDCLTPTRKGFQKENQAFRIINYVEYWCCFHAEKKDYCNNCLQSEQIKELIIIRNRKNEVAKDYIRNVDPRKKWIDLKCSIVAINGVRMKN